MLQQIPSSPAGHMLKMNHYDEFCNIITTELLGHGDNLETGHIAKRRKHLKP